MLDAGVRELPVTIRYTDRQLQQRMTNRGVLFAELLREEIAQEICLPASAL
jgi:hypothetical protein